MHTCCFCEPELTYHLTTFLEDLNEFLVYTTPTAVAVVLWKVFITNRRTPRGDITVLRLDESAETYSPTITGGPTKLVIMLYLLTGMFTFGMGVLAFAAVRALS
jgi:hypothetical protein